VVNILYPTRGADHSYRNQDRVISLVREQEASLLFLYVSDVRFLDRFASPVPVELVKSQLDETGEFLLAMAQERAEKQEVKASTLVRRGAFLDVLQEVIQEHEIDTVVLGRPAEETAITAPGYIDEVAQSLAAESGVEVLIVDGGEIVQRFQPRQGSTQTQ
jgi:nucleotide-binding universal stress UspA family protein